MPVPRASPVPPENDADLGFIYYERKDGSVDITHHGRPAATLRGAVAAKFLVKARAGFSQAQQAMARATGNYKRGNERR